MSPEKDDNVGKGGSAEKGLVKKPGLSNSCEKDSKTTQDEEEVGRQVLSLFRRPK